MFNGCLVLFHNIILKICTPLSSACNLSTVKSKPSLIVKLKQIILCTCIMIIFDSNIYIFKPKLIILSTCNTKYNMLVMLHLKWVKLSSSFQQGDLSGMNTLPTKTFLFQSDPTMQQCKQFLKTFI